MVPSIFNLMNIQNSIKVFICTVFFSLTFQSVGYSQDPIYSQYYNSPTLINPAFSGVTGFSSLSLSYRKQWPNLGDIYNTYSLAYDRAINQSNSSIGFSLLRDSAGNGTLTSTDFSFKYSYKLQVNKEYQLKIGLSSSYVSQRLDQTKLLFGDQIDPFNGSAGPGGFPIPTTENFSGNTSNGYIDVGAGLLLYSPLFYAGISFDHINGPSQNFIDERSTEDLLPLRINVHAGTQINFDRGNKKDEGSFISPNVLFAKQGDFYQLNVGAYTGYRSYFGGLWFRNAWSNNDAIIFTVGVKSSFFKIAYSYDYTVSDLGIDAGGSHELGMLFNFGTFQDKRRSYNDCFSLFR